MAQRMFIVICVMMIFISSGQAADDSVLNSHTNLQPAYVEQTNGLFAICAFDPDSATLLRFIGVEVSRDHLPKMGPVHGTLVFALGQRPPRDPKDPAGWKPRPQDLYHYGDIPYPITDVDPPIEYGIDREGNLLMGVRLRGVHYAIHRVKNPSLKKDVPKRYWSKVIHIEPPAHRSKELEELQRTLLKENPSPEKVSSEEK